MYQEPRSRDRGRKVGEGAREHARCTEGTEGGAQGGGAEQSHGKLELI